MSCQTTDYNLDVSPTSFADQYVSFQSQSTITVTFVPPSGSSITNVTYTSTPSTLPSGYPAPTVGTNYITFYNPGALVAEFDVSVSYNPTKTPKFKPVNSCP
jgi:hypothetical protein